ncbi:MAG: 16S rRNA (cytosine(1402)-N(4))-methyltransferase, partial [Methylophilales bacterium 16-45-7]
MMKGATSAPNSASVSAPLTEQSAPHITVLLQEAVDALDVKSDSIYVDGTFGRGGHSRLILSQLGSEGRLIGMDRDMAAFSVGKEVDDARFQIVHRHFSEIADVLSELDVAHVDG